MTDHRKWTIKHGFVEEPIRRYWHGPRLVQVWLDATGTGYIWSIEVYEPDGGCAYEAWLPDRQALPDPGACLTHALERISQYQ